MSSEEKLANPWQKHKDKVTRRGEVSDCPIWGTNLDGDCVVNYDPQHDLYSYWSPRAGGVYTISGEVKDNGISNSIDKKLSLSRWIYEQNKQGHHPQIFTTNIGSDITSLPKLSVHEQMQHLLMSFAELPTKPSEGMFTRRGANSTSKFLSMAYCECYDDTDYEWLVGAAIKNEILEYVAPSRIISAGYRARLTPAGLTNIQEIRKTTQSEQAFVAMWFDNSMTDVYNNAIKPAIEAAGYRAYRVDEDRSHSDQITNKILAEIKNSKFLIADFTHGTDGARGGVYYEAGYAQGLGIPVLWLIKDDGSKMHFDTNHYPHTFWNDNELDELTENLKASIIAHQHIGKGPL